MPVHINESVHAYKSVIVNKPDDVNESGHVYKSVLVNESVYVSESNLPPRFCCC